MMNQTMTSSLLPDQIYYASYPSILFALLIIIALNASQQTADGFAIVRQPSQWVSPVQCIAQILDSTTQLKAAISQGGVSFAGVSRTQWLTKAQLLLSLLALVQLVKLSSMGGIFWTQACAWCYSIQFVLIALLEHLDRSRDISRANSWTSIPASRPTWSTHGRLHPKLPPTADILHWLFIYVLTTRVFARIFWSGPAPDKCSDYLAWYLFGDDVPQSEAFSALSLKNWLTYACTLPLATLLLFIVPFGPYGVIGLTPAFTIIGLAVSIATTLYCKEDRPGQRRTWLAWLLPSACVNIWILYQYKTWWFEDVLIPWVDRWSCTLLGIVHPSHAFVLGLPVVSFLVSLIPFAIYDQIVQLNRHRYDRREIQISDVLAGIPWDSLGSIWMVLMMILFYTFAYKAETTYRPIWASYLG